MNKIAKYTGKYSEGYLLPKLKKTIKASSLVPESQSGALDSAVGIFIRCSHGTFLVAKNQRVPPSSALVTDRSGRICGIPAPSDYELRPGDYDGSLYMSKGSMAVEAAVFFERAEKLLYAGLLPTVRSLCDAAKKAMEGPADIEAKYRVVYDAYNEAQSYVFDYAPDCFGRLTEGFDPRPVDGIERY